MKTNLPLIYPDLHQLLILITTHTNLGQQTIPNQTIQAMERVTKKITYDDKEKNTLTTETND